MDMFINQLKPILFDWIIPAGITLVFIYMALSLVRYMYPDRAATRLGRQIGQILTVIVGFVAVILVLPFVDATRGQLLGLFGLVITAVIGLSSTTFVSNAMAGLMLRAINSFRSGDFIQLDAHFGRVTEKGLLHTEIQTEDRDLVTLPNLFVITHPVRVVRSSGTLISCAVSLGYDIYRRRISTLLKEAAVDTELTEPFVRITELGNHAVSYRIYGFLDDVERLISKRTELRASVLDRLHNAGIEVASPTQMNQRQLNPDARILPPDKGHDLDIEAGQPEDMMFDKANFASRLENFQNQRDVLELEIEEYQKELSKVEEPAKQKLEQEIAWRKRQITSLDGILQNKAPE
ncbi:MAG: mechanosensitive ion channel [Pseudomonadales bacterium]|nr:mechanosensitive ion channel [Pseudomonadales bacterium]